MRNQYKVLQERYEIVREAILKPDQELAYWKDRIKTVLSSFANLKSFKLEDINNALNKDSNSIVHVSFEDIKKHYPYLQQTPSGVFQARTDKPRIYLNKSYLKTLFSKEPRIQKSGLNALTNALYHELVHLYQFFWVKGFINRDQNKYLKTYKQDKNEIMAWAAFIARTVLDQEQNNKEKAIDYINKNAWALSAEYPESVKKKMLRYIYDYINHFSNDEQSV